MDTLMYNLISGVCCLTTIGLTVVVLLLPMVVFFGIGQIIKKVASETGKKLR